MQDGTVWESTGKYGESALLRYRIGASRPDRQATLPPELYGEGICRAGGHIWQLTWRERVALRWDAGSMELLGTVRYNREGWGICLAGDRVLTSDGSSELVWRDPETLEPLGIIRIRIEGKRMDGLNDLDCAAGRVWANVLARPWLVGIDPESGEVTDVVDARVADERHRGDPQAVLNGLAPLPGEQEFLLTGKSWRHMYHVRLAEGRRPRRLLDARLGIASQ